MTRKRARQTRQREYEQKHQLDSHINRIQPVSSNSNTAQSPESDSDDDFLLTAEEKRRKRANANNQSTDTSSSSTSSQPAALKGYHYDASTRKYFKLGVGFEFAAERHQARQQAISQSISQSVAQANQSVTAHNNASNAKKKRAFDRIRALKQTNDSSHVNVGIESQHADFVLSSDISNQSAIQPTSLNRLMMYRKILPYCQSISSPILLYRASTSNLLHQASLFDVDNPRNALSCLPVSGECGMSFNAGSSSISISGLTVEHDEAGLIHSRKSHSFHSVYQLAPREHDHESRRSLDNDVDMTDALSRPCVPFTAELTYRHESPSRITSVHRISTAGMNVASPLFFPSHYHPSNSFLCETLLGDSGASGSFRILHDDGQLRSACLLPERSVFCSDLHPNALLRPIAAIGAAGAVVLFDCEPESRRTITLSKSDVLAVHFSSPFIVDAGQRNGTVRSIDIRQSNATIHQAREQSIKVKSSICWIRRLSDSDSHLMLVGATNHTMCLMDNRSLARPVVEYIGHRNECSNIRGTMLMDHSVVACGGDDGKVRLWNLTSGQLLATHTLDQFSLIASNAVAGRVGYTHQAPAVHSIEWMERYQSLIGATSDGLACLTVGVP